MELFQTEITTQSKEEQQINNKKKKLGKIYELLTVISAGLMTTK